MMMQHRCFNVHAAAKRRRATPGVRLVDAADLLRSAQGMYEGREGSGWKAKDHAARCPGEIVIRIERAIVGGEREVLRFLVEVSLGLQAHMPVEVAGDADDLPQVDLAIGTAEFGGRGTGDCSVRRQIAVTEENVPPGEGLARERRRYGWLRLGR